MTSPFETAEMAALETALLACARAGTTIAYTELAARIALRPPHRIHRLTLALEARIRLDHDAGRPPLAALVVGKFGLPGRGFFQLLGELNRYVGPDSGAEAADHYRKERDAAIAFWGST